MRPTCVSTTAAGGRSRTCCGCGKASRFRFSAEGRTVEQHAIAYAVSRYRFVRVRVSRERRTASPGARPPSGAWIWGARSAASPPRYSRRTRVLATLPDRGHRRYGQARGPSLRRTHAARGRHGRTAGHRLQRAFRAPPQADYHRRPQPAAFHRQCHRHERHAAGGVRIRPGGSAPIRLYYGNLMALAAILLNLMKRLRASAPPQPPVPETCDPPTAG